MSFQFSLRPLSRLRRVQEQRERMRLRLLTSSRSRLQQEIEGAGHAREQELEALEQKLLVGVSAPEFHLGQGVLQSLTERRFQLTTLLQAVELQLQGQMGAFRESRKKRKALDTLEEGQRRAYELLQSRREQQRIDDWFGQRRPAKNREPS